MHPLKIIISGIGTEVGKTIVSAIYVTMLQGDYWKPIECGTPSDTNTIMQLLNLEKPRIHSPAYSLKNPVSPHHAAQIENMTIDSQSILPPKTANHLIIEGVGGILVPYTNSKTTLDLFASWNCHWIVVISHYLGSINHTLLTLEVLKQRNVCIMGLVFNGENHPSEEVILNISKLPLIGRLLPEKVIHKQIIERYATEWKNPLNLLLNKIEPQFGTPLLKSKLRAHLFL